MMDGLMEDIKGGFRPQELMEAGKVTAGAVTGAVIARIVVKKLAAIKKKDSQEAMLPAWAPGIAPLLVGVAVAGGTAKTAPRFGAGVAAGMFVVGAGSILSAALSKSTAAADSVVGQIRDNLAGLGAVDTYDSAMLAGLGAGDYDFGVSRYMNGAPVQAQQLMGAPVDIQQLRGLGASPSTVSIVPPMSASLYA